MMSLDEELDVVLAKLDYRMRTTCLSFAQSLRSNKIKFVDAEDLIQDFRLGVWDYMKRHPEDTNMANIWRAGLRNICNAYSSYMRKSSKPDMEYFGIVKDTRRAIPRNYTGNPNLIESINAHYAMIEKASKTGYYIHPTTMTRIKLSDLVSNLSILLNRHSSEK